METWCDTSERRFLQQIMIHKPAGISRHLQMACLIQKMNVVCEDESDVDFEEVLSPEDYAFVMNRQFEAAEAEANEKENDAALDTSNVKYNTRFEPSYALRPTAQMLWKKLNAMYDMERIDAFEYFPPEFDQKVEFYLPDSSFAELIKEKRESNRMPVTPTTSKTPTPRASVEPPASNSASRSRRRRRESGDTLASSRSSTPNLSRRS